MRVVHDEWESCLIVRMGNTLPYLTLTKCHRHIKTAEIGVI
jgi:hypothetical protein